MATNTTAAPNNRPSCSDLQTLEQRLACLADAGPQAIEARLAELDREWTAGRATKATLGVLSVVGFVLAAFFGPWWLILPALGGVLFLHYLVSRTSWLGRGFQVMGFRAGSDVDQEKMALKVLRGDFRQLPTVLDIESHDDIARLEGEGGIAVEPETAKVDPASAAKSAVEATTKA
jgi:hypothetical protein